MKNMNRLNKFLEVFWLIISIVSIVLVVYVYSSIGIEDNLILLFFPVIAIAMYVFRKRMSKRMNDQN